MECDSSQLVKQLDTYHKTLIHRAQEIEFRHWLGKSIIILTTGVYPARQGNQTNMYHQEDKRTKHLESMCAV